MYAFVVGALDGQTMHQLATTTCMTWLFPFAPNVHVHVVHMYTCMNNDNGMELTVASMYVLFHGFNSCGQSLLSVKTENWTPWKFPAKW